MSLADLGQSGSSCRMRTVLQLFLILNTIIHLVCPCSERESCFTFSVPDDGIVESSRMSGHVISTVRYEGFVKSCIGACALDCRCRSFNIRNDLGVCELNSEYENKTLVRDEQSTFMRMRVQSENKNTSMACEPFCCSPNPCKHGNCTELCHHPSRFNCTCADGFTGQLCDSNIDECLSSPCQHSGTCVDEVNGFTCQCPQGFSGKLCETDINECASHPCLNNGTCADQINSYKCACVPGFTGQRCETNINDCTADACNNGTCVDGVGSFTCDCRPGYTGQRCESEIKNCQPGLCLHGGACVDEVITYSCNCSTGFTGRNCEVNVDDCPGHQCQHGVCVDGVRGYTCRCTPGYEGQYCQTEINECASGPCVHGACVDAVNNYTCTCSTGYTGRNCSVDIDHCRSKPCKNGATCQDRLTDYTCSCRGLWFGSQCHLYPTTCSHLRSYGHLTSKEYTIDPDGDGHEHPFQAFCDMSRDGGVTVISHNSEARTETSGCEDAGCYKRDIHYTGVNTAQLAALTRASAQCSQFIKYECKNTKLLKEGTSWWVSRDGARMNYWGGAAKDSGKCACGIKGNCVNGEPKCNCDASKLSWYVDEGLLTDKTTLPVSQLRFGDLTWILLEKGFHTLGKFHCSGIA